ncbi:MAG: hypothetical protein ACM37W_19610 [Actinomycetota bacterium]
MNNIFPKIWKFLNQPLFIKQSSYLTTQEQVEHLERCWSYINHLERCWAKKYSPPR